MIPRKANNIRFKVRALMTDSAIVAISFMLQRDDGVCIKAIAAKCNVAHSSASNMMSQFESFGIVKKKKVGKENLCFLKKEKLDKLFDSCKSMYI